MATYALEKWSDDDRFHVVYVVSGDYPNIVKFVRARGDSPEDLRLIDHFTVPAPFGYHGAER